jgi:cobalt-precorrin-5B (C1)-methyltransferase
MTKIIWFYQEDFIQPEFLIQEFSFLEQTNFYYHKIPINDEFERMEFSRQIIEKEIEKHKISYVLITGDGKINHALETTLIVHEIPENIIETIAYYNPNPLKRDPPENGILRTGFTTGACAAASAKAATKAILEKKILKEIQCTLPNRMEVVFPLRRCELYEDRAICSVIKDAGDDPDCTHLAEIVAEVKLIPEKKVILKGGKGVAVVTKTGLGLEVGGPAINPVPRKNITENVLEVLQNTPYGAEVTISVPRGREMALDTTNARLGLIGGISILGTTGIVKPYSTAAYRASIIQAIQVAKERGINTLVFTTGGRSEQYAMDYLKSQKLELPIEAFIQVGDFIGTGIKHAKKIKIPHVIIFGMIGKLSKMADGVTQTHQAGSNVNMELLANYAKAKGSSEEIQNEIKKANTARHVLEICKKNNIPIADLICRDVVRVMMNYAYNKKREELKQDYPKEWSKEFKIDCYMIDFDGNLLGFYKGENNANQ